MVTFHKLDENTTRVTAQIDWDPQGLLEKVGALVGAGSHAVKKDLDNFKKFIEGRGGETGAWRGDVESVLRPRRPLSRTFRDGAGVPELPYFQAIAHRGACGKTPGVPEDRWS